MHRVDEWGISFKVCRESIRKWSGDTRIWAIVILVCLFEWIRIEQLRGACIEQGLSISCWYFPHLIIGMQAIFYYFGVLLLFCETHKEVLVFLIQNLHSYSSYKLLH